MRADLLDVLAGTKKPPLLERGHHKGQIQPGELRNVDPGNPEVIARIRENLNQELYRTMETMTVEGRPFVEALLLKCLRSPFLTAKLIDKMARDANAGSPGAKPVVGSIETLLIQMSTRGTTDSPSPKQGREVSHAIDLGEDR